MNNHRWIIHGRNIWPCKRNSWGGAVGPLECFFFFFHIHVLLNSLLSSPHSCDTSRVLLLLRRINSTCAPLCETEGPFSKRINQLNLFDKKRQKLYWFAFWWSVADISPSCEADAAEKSSIGARDFKTRPLPLIFRSVSREIISSPASLFSPSCETSPNLRGGICKSSSCLGLSAGGSLAL